MIAPLFEIRDTPTKGKGLFAQEFIPAGTIINFDCADCHLLSAEDLAAKTHEEQEHILFYNYTRKDGSVVLACGDSVYLNHSCNANILYSGHHFDIVVRDMQPGEEATIDYRFFYESPDFRMPCDCGAPNCTGEIVCEHPADVQLQAFWDAKISRSMRKIRTVPQPLKTALLDYSDEYRAFLLPRRSPRKIRDLVLTAPGELAHTSLY
ncbi:MAG TPA: SET domain-containing protein-lysine N-methyltransferase [Candidatus Peribacteraceae bacterium]|nr:SET domain-containing protein-lysine N-methyltransferase [Candidatus Peribacteraceae bacterium]